MTYEQYWYGDVRMVEAYLEAEKRRKERRNLELHLQGMYFYEALCDASPIFHAFAKQGTKPHPYRSEPYKLAWQSEKKVNREQKEKQEENEMLRAKLYMSQMMRAGKNWK
jgi:hypothetical protein